MRVLFFTENLLHGIHELDDAGISDGVGDELSAFL